MLREPLAGPWEQLLLPAHICCPSALRFVNIPRKIRFSFGSEPHLLRVAVVKYAFPEASNYPFWMSNAEAFPALSVWDFLCLEYIRLLPDNLPSAVQVWNHIAVAAPKWSDLAFPSTFRLLQLPTGALFAVIRYLGFIPIFILNGICTGNSFTQSREQTGLEKSLFGHRAGQV